MKYLLDTSVCVGLLRKRPEALKFASQCEPDDCAISIMTAAELSYGAYCSERPEENLREQRKLLSKFRAIDIATCVDIFAQEKVRLRKEGLIIEDADLFIAATAKAENLILVTDNIKHMSRIEGIQILSIG